MKDEIIFFLFRSISFSDFEELLTAYNVRNAVYAFGSAVQKIHSSLCGGARGVCDDMKSSLTGELILEYLGKVESKSRF